MQTGNLADWVGGIGSLLAIGGVWWQLDYDKKCKSKQELADKLTLEEQNLRTYQGHLQNVRTRLMTFNMHVIEHFKKHQKFSTSETDFLMDSLKDIVKSIESSMREISSFKKIANVSKKSNGIDIEYSTKVLGHIYDLQVLLVDDSEGGQTEAIIDKLREISVKIYKYTDEYLSSEIAEIDSKLGT
jgi:hypothetical protein